MQIAASGDGTLHAGMGSDDVRDLQERLRALGYPAGNVDGIYGEQTYRAVVLFQHDNDLNGAPGIWQPAYDSILDEARPMLPKRKSATHRDLETLGDRPTAHMNFLQRVFAWMFGASAAAQIFEGGSVLDSISGLRDIVEPAGDALAWISANRFILIAGGCVAMIAFVRLMRNGHVNAYRNFDYQGPAPQQAAKEA
jgi:peptidoglycan hydrolase-like protein with peptidoglycan-binding domain